jgi:hypothetical protein
MTSDAPDTPKKDDVEPVTSGDSRVNDLGHGARPICTLGALGHSEENGHGPHTHLGSGMLGGAWQAWPAPPTTYAPVQTGSPWSCPSSCAR